jgi:hypothetical protein
MGGGFPWEGVQLCFEFLSITARGVQFCEAGGWFARLLFDIVWIEVYGLKGCSIEGCRDKEDLALVGDTQVGGIVDVGPVSGAPPF